MPTVDALLASQIHSVSYRVAVLNQSTLEAFLADVPRCAEALRGYEQDGNRLMLEALDEQIALTRNALAALALCAAAGCALGPLLYGLREYRGEPHRVEPIGILNGVEFFDDSKGTNVGATVAALQGLGADLSGGKLVGVWPVAARGKVR